jgi:hypothetical protein
MMRNDEYLRLVACEGRKWGEMGCTEDGGRPLDGPCPFDAATVYGNVSRGVSAALPAKIPLAHHPEAQPRLSQKRSCESDLHGRSLLPYTQRFEFGRRDRPR